MSDETFELKPGRLTLAEVRRLSETGTKIALAAAGREAVEAALAVCWRTVNFAPPTATQDASRISIAYAASRRSWAPASTSCALPSRS